MTEKLLCKPPFRYIHDIYTATLSKTNFGAGLYQGDELNSKSFESKESKQNWLVKLITLTELMIGEKIDIKPSMILAGQQADKTNVWLQQMFQAATAGIDTTPYVNQILGIGGDEEGDGGQDDGGQDQAQAELAAQQAAEEEERRQAAEQEKAERKKRAEEKKRR